MECKENYHTSSSSSHLEQGSNPYAFSSVLPYDDNSPAYREIIPLRFAEMIKETYLNCQNKTTKTQDDNFTALSTVYIRLEKKPVFITEAKIDCIIRIKITSLTHNSYFHIASARDFPTLRERWTFSILSKGRLIKEHYVLQKKEMPPLSRLIPLPYLNGDEYEYYERPFNGRNDEKVYSPEHWDTWKETGDDMVSHFDNVIYPCFIAGVEKIHHIMQKQLTILELGAGDGKLASRLLCCLDSTKNAIAEYHAVDKNEASLQKAKQLSSWTSKLTIHEDDLMTVDCKPFLDQADVIILCSIVAYTVFPKSKSKDLLRRCKEWLSPSGVILITSYAAPYFDRKQYEGLGFTVLNTSVPIPNRSTFDEFKPFYILGLPKSAAN